ncbi:MAG: hypothetical protein LBS69_03835, partial [Prevotellaceae bacterium]|nr:hypothetical protein [Prevotellaceae bacterium]
MDAPWQTDTSIGNWFWTREGKIQQPEIHHQSVKAFSSKRYHRIKSVSMLGVEGELKFTQKADALTVVLPEKKPCAYAICLKVTPALIPVP